MPTFEKYAEYYDQIYHDKNYSEETSFVSGLILAHANQPPSSLSIIDLACGTGRHAEEFAKLGYKISLSDRSADMIRVAKHRLNEPKIRADFYNESFETCHRIGAKNFDAAMALFSSIDYLTEPGALGNLLESVKSLLAPKGIFIFDFWNGYAVMDQYSPVRVRDVSAGHRRIVRNSVTKVDPLEQIADVKMSFLVLENGKISDEFEELHRMRYYFPREMKELVKRAGFELVKECPFLEPEGKIEPSTWNLTYVIRSC